MASNVTDIDIQERATEQAAARSRSSLLHYFNLAVEGGVRGDMAGEVTDIITDAVQAGAHAAMALLLTTLGLRSFSDLAAVVRLAGLLGAVPLPPPPPVVKPKRRGPRFPFARGWIAARHGAVMLGDMGDVEVGVVAAFFKGGLPATPMNYAQVWHALARDIRPDEEDRHLDEVLAGLCGRGVIERCETAGSVGKKWQIPVRIERLLPQPEEEAEPSAPGVAATVEQTEAEEDAHGRRMTVVVGGVTQVFRWVPEGTFTMGSPKGEKGRWDDEGPQHEVALQGYWLGETPVTQALWEAVMGENPSEYVGAERPVETVSWEDSVAFIAKLNALAPGLDARLPTEAEWERACRAGTTTATWAGNLTLDRDGVRAPELDAVAWYYGNSSDGTKPVRGKQPNPLGLYDMLGNVYEWCSDVFAPYEAGSLTDPRGPAEGMLRVIRGGFWYSGARRVRAARRIGALPQDRLDDLGLRLARGHQV